MKAAMENCPLNFDLKTPAENRFFSLYFHLDMSRNRNSVSDANILLKKILFENIHEVHHAEPLLRRQRRAAYRLKDWKDHYLFPLYPMDYPGSIQVFLFSFDNQ